MRCRERLSTEINFEAGFTDNAYGGMVRGYTVIKHKGGSSSPYAIIALDFRKVFDMVSTHTIRRRFRAAVLSNILRRLPREQ